jgi:hypothetical protein
MVLLENDAVSYHNDSYVRFVTFYACTVLDRANAHIHKEQNIRLSLPDDEEMYDPILLPFHSYIALFYSRVFGLPLP